MATSVPITATRTGSSARLGGGQALEDRQRFRVGPQNRGNTGKVPREPAADVRARCKDAPGLGEPAPVSLPPRHDPFGNRPARSVSQLRQATIAAILVGLAAIPAALSDQIDARADRVKIVNRPVVCDTPLLEQFKQALGQPDRVVNVGMSRRDRLQHVCDRFSIAARFAAPDRSTMITALFPEQPSRSPRTHRDRPDAFAPKAAFEITEMPFRSATQSMRDHEEDRAKIGSPGSPAQSPYPRPLGDQTNELPQLSAREPAQALTLEDGANPAKPARNTRFLRGAAPSRTSFVPAVLPWCGSGTTKASQSACRKSHREQDF